MAQQYGEEKFIGVPTVETVIHKGDTLICYGRKEANESLSRRPNREEGDAQHEQERQKEQRNNEQRINSGVYS